MAANVDEHPTAERGQRGTTLVLAAATMLVLLGMGGFAVDLGWAYLKGVETQRAAEAAALGGVVFMPKPAADPFIGSDAYLTALDAAGRNGYEASADTTVTPKEVLGHSNQLDVEISTQIPTFFMRLFGIRQLTYTKSARADHLPPLILGSDDPFLGEDPETPGRDTDFWLSVNGTYTGKNEGDPYSTVCYWGSGGSSGKPYPPVNPGACVDTGNYQFRDPAYYYAVRVPASEAGTSLTVQVYDGAWTDPGTPGNQTSDYHYRYDVTDYVTSFALYRPDSTPNDPTDNASLVCSRDYYAAPHSSYDPAESDAWTSLCTTTAEEGIYVLAVSVSGDTYSNNKYSLRALVGGSVSNSIELSGIGALSLAMHEPDSSPEFKVVRLDEIYAGSTLGIGLWDAGDLSTPGVLRFTGSLASLDCLVRDVDAYGVVDNDWHADDGGPGCMSLIEVKEHNGEWLEFRFDIPDNYTCPGSCWATVRYEFGSAPHDRTTWTAQILGGPVHLLPQP